MSAVPPSVTARMASSSSSCPALLPSALFTFELMISPAMPAVRLQNTYKHTVISRERTPATRAAIGLMPILRTNRPSAVCVSAR